MSTAEAANVGSAVTGPDSSPRKPPPLAEIVRVGLDLLAEVDAGEGELTPVLIEHIDRNVTDLNTKAEAYAAFAKVLREEGEACKRLAESFTTKGARKLAYEGDLKARMKLALEALGQTRAIGLTGGAAIQKNGGKAALKRLVAEHLLDNEPEKHVPAEYLKTTVSVDWEKVRAALDAGTVLTFAQLERGTHLQWK